MTSVRPEVLAARLDAEAIDVVVTVPATRAEVDNSAASAPAACFLKGSSRGLNYEDPGLSGACSQGRPTRWHEDYLTPPSRSGPKCQCWAPRGSVAPFLR